MSVLSRQEFAPQAADAGGAARGRRAARGGAAGDVESGDEHEGVGRDEDVRAVNSGCVEHTTTAKPEDTSAAIRKASPHAASRIL